MESDSPSQQSGFLPVAVRRRRGLLVGFILLSVLSAPAVGHANTIFFSDCDLGFHRSVYFSNEVVCVSGTADTVIDGLFPSADVYVTENRSWSAGDSLSGLDVTGIAGLSSPNRVGGLPFGAGAFFDEIIWLPALTPGEYDVVMDEDGDGFYNADPDNPRDRILGLGGSFGLRVVPAPLGAFTVNVAAIKLEAASEVAKWLTVKKTFELIAMIKTLLDVQKALVNPGGEIGEEIAAITAGAGMADIPLGYNDWVLITAKKIMGALSDEMIEKYANLVLDPPDPDYEHMVRLDILEVEAAFRDFLLSRGLPASYPYPPAGTSPLEKTLRALIARLVEQAAIVDALVRSYEKFLGATDADDHEWAVIHANGLERYADLLAENVQAVKDAASAVKAEFIALTLGAQVVDVSVVEEVQARVAAAGLTPEERRRFKDAGWSDEGLESLIDYLISLEIPPGDYTPSDVMDEVVDASDTILAEAQALSADAEGVRDDLEFFIGPLFEPIADAGGPYAGLTGIPIDLDGIASLAEDTSLTFDWDLNLDGVFDDAFGVMPSPVFDTAGSRLVGLQVTNDFGLQDIAYVRVDVDLDDLPPAITGFTPSDVDVKILVGDTLDLTVTASDPEGEALSFIWTDNGDEVLASSPAFTFSTTPADAGFHLIRVRVSDTDPFSPDAFEQRGVVVLFPDGDGDGFRSNADCDDGDENVNPDRPEIVGDGIDNDCDPATTDGGQGPTAAFFNVPPTGTQNEAVQFNDASSDPNGDIVTFDWDFGDGGASTDRNPSHTYANGGAFDVSLTVTDAQNNVDTVVQQVVVLEPPAADFLFSPDPAIANEPIQFTDQSTVPVGTIVSWDWDFDDGGTSTLQNPEHTFTSTGTFDVVLTVTDDNGNARTVTKQVLVALRPTADFSASIGNVVGVNVVFTDLSTDDGFLVDWFWGFGDGATSNEQNPTHAYTSAGTFDVTLTVTDDEGAADTVTMPVAVGVGDPPVAGFSLSPLLPVAGEVVQFTDESTDPDNRIVSHLYDFGDGSTSPEANPTHTYSDSGNVDVTLTVTDEAGNQNSLTLTGVPIRARPVADFSAPAATSVGVSTLFENQSTDQDGTLVAYSWDFGDGASSTAESPTHTYTTAGNFNVTLTVTDAHGLTAAITNAVQVGAGGAPSADFSFSPVSPVVGVNVSFTDLSTDDGTITAWSWQFGDGGTSEGQNPTHSYGASGDFTVTLTVTDSDGAVNTTDQVVSVGSGASPTAAFTPAAPFVVGGVTPFNDESTDPDNRIVSWLWDFGDGGSSTEQNPSHVYTARGSVDVSLTVTDEAGSSDTLTITGVPVIGRPSASFLFAPAEPTTADAVQFTDTSAAPDGTIVSRSWDFDDGTNSDLQDPTHTFPAGGIFNVRLTVTDSNGLMGTTVQAIEVTGIQRPVAAFDHNPKDAASGDIVGFVDESTDDGTIVAWDWDFGDGGTSEDQNPIHSYAEGGTFTVSLTVTDDDGLTDTASRDVTIRATPVARFAPAKGMNVAFLGDGASIADFSDATVPGFPPENAIDSNANSVWSVSSDGDVFMVVELTGGGPHVVQRVVLRGSSNTFGMKDFEVLVSNTGTEEDDFVTVVNGTVPQNNAFHEFTFPGIQARFVKLLVIDNWGNPISLQVRHFEVWSRDREGGIVSLRNGPKARIVDVSSELGSTSSAEKVIDGSINTRWETEVGATTDQFVKVRLGGADPHTIDRVQIRGFRNIVPRDFEIRVSTTTEEDGAFTTVFSGRMENNDDRQEFTFPAVEARFVELFILNVHGTFGRVGVTTFQVFTVDGHNAARGKGVGAFLVDFSSRFSSSSTVAPANIIDNNPGTRWDTAGVTDEFATVLLVPGGPWRINKVLIHAAFGTFSPKDFEVRVSSTGLDPADFTTVLSATLSSDGQPHWFMFPPVPAKYVQLFLKNNHGSTSTIRMQEFQVYSTGLGEAMVPFDNFSTDADGEIVSYFWDFGDGTTSTERNPVHTYGASGTYTVVLTVTDDEGLTHTVSQEYTVLVPPSVDFTVSKEFPFEAENVTLTGIDNNVESSIIAWQWESSIPDISRPTDRTVNARFDDSGPVEVTLAVTDSQLLTRSVTKTITVLNQPPTANAGGDLTTTWGNPERVRGIPGDPSSEDSRTLTCDWDFGDGNTLQVTECSGFDLSQRFYTYEVPGTYVATFTVTDKDGDWASDSKVVTVLPRDSYTTIFGELDIPVEGGEITAQARLTDLFEPDRGTPLEGEIMTFRLGEQIMDVSTDADGLASATFTVPAGEQGPVWATFAGDTFYNGSRDRPFLNGDVFVAIGQGFVRRYAQDGEFINLFDTTSMSNETAGMCFDAEGNLYATSFQAGEMTKFDRAAGETIHPWGGPFSTFVESCVFDSDSDVIYTGEVDGASNIRKFDLDGNFLATYDTTTTARGTDWIDLAADRCTMFYTSEDDEIMRYDVCNDQQLDDFFPEDTDPGLNRPCFALRIRPNGEVLTACRNEVVRIDADGNIIQRYQRGDLGDQAIIPNQLFALNLDPDGTSFWTVGFNSGNAFKVDIETGAVLSSFPVDREGPTAAGLAIFGEPTAATDNRPPVAEDQEVMLDENTFIDIRLTATDPELDGLTFEIISPPAKGDLTGTPPDVTYTPDLDFFGPDSFTFKANDGESDSNIATVSIEVGLVNGPPVADAGGPYIGVEGTTFTLDASASTDPDLQTGDSISFAWDLDGDGQFDDGAGMTVNTAYEDIASVTVTVVVTDSFGETDTAEAVVLVNNELPVVDSGPDRNIVEGDTVDLPPATFTDVGELDTHTAVVDWGDGSPTEMGVVNEADGSGTVAGSHAYPAPGVFTAEVCVTDDDGGTGCDSFQVTVESLNNPPDLDPIADIELPEGAALDIPVSATDPEQDPIGLVDAGLPDFAFFTDNGDGTGTLSLAPDFDDADVYPGASVTASDGSDSDTEFFTITVTEVNRVPTADAGPDQNVETNTRVQLDGSGSSDPDGDLITYLWSFDQVPQRSTLTDQDLSDPTAAMPTFTPDVDGAYTLRLVVMDDELRSEPDTVEIDASTPNVPPNADAGPDQNRFVGDTVDLDGTGSNDPDDGPEPLGFLWTFVSLPAGSGLDDGSISGAAEAEASFVPDAAGTYVVDLEVSDGEDTDNDQVSIFVAVANVPPNADAGVDLMGIAVGEEAVLDGTGSNDPDDGPDALSFAWRFVSVPGTSSLTNADILGPDSAQPSFTPDVSGDYVLELEVSDGEDADVDNVTVMVVEPNLPPIANAGDNQEVELGEDVLLDGTGSSDPDNGPEPLTFSWGFVSVPPGSGLADGDIVDAATGMPMFTPDVEGDYTLELTVSDGDLESSDRVTVSVAGPNEAPVADAGADRNVETGAEVELDGSDSFDPDGDMITYAWFFEEIPAGSSLTDQDLTDPASPMPMFTPDVGGLYVLGLIVMDAGLKSEPDFVEILAAAPNVPPNADAGPDQNKFVGDMVVLDGTESSDPDNGPVPLRFLWTFVSVPAASTLEDGNIVDATEAVAGFVPDVPGTYELNLGVTDGEDADDDQTRVFVTVRNVPPNADAGDDLIIDLGDAALPDGSGSDDPDMGPEALAFAWRFVSKPAGSALTNGDILDAGTAMPTFLPDVAGVYVLELEVFDGEDNDFDNMSVTVEPPSEQSICDLDESGDVDILDIYIVLGFRNQEADQCPACDIDGDGIVTVLDARKCVLECTRPRCVTD